MRFRTSFILLAGLTLINLLFFLFRDHFSYQPYADYHSLYKACDDDCISKWKEITDDYPANETVEAKKITDSVAMGKETIDKVKSIGAFLYRRFGKQLGNPSKELRSASPLVQFKKLMADTSEELWCGNFAQMFSLFCWSQGIVTRTIEIMYPTDHHILNECYIPEMKKWVMVDLTNNFMARKKQDGFLGLADFKHHLAAGDGVGIDVLFDTLAGGKQLPKQYKGDYPTYYYHYLDGKKAYRPSSKIKRYFLPVSWYDIFDDKDRSNFTFYLKQIFSLLWVVSLLFFLFSPKKLKT